MDVIWQTNEMDRINGFDSLDRRQGDFRRKYRRSRIDNGDKKRSMA